MDEQKTRVIQAVQGLGLFSKKEIYKEYYDMTDVEIEQAEQELKEDQEKAAEQAAQEQGGAEAAPEEAGGQEGMENTPPTTNEEIVSALESIKDLVLEEDKKDVLSRIIIKQQQKS